jgi:hypothetical protein
MNELIEYMKLHLISLEQDNDVVETELSKMADMNSDEYEDLNIENISLNGQIIATRHLLSVANDILLKTNEGK